MPAVTFLPSYKVVEFSPGERVIEIARRGDVSINSECGGKGKCGKCKVEIVEVSAQARPVSEPLPEEMRLLPSASGDHRYRLACFARVFGDVSIVVSAENHLSEFRPRKAVKEYPVANQPAVEKIKFDLATGGEKTVTERINAAFEKCGIDPPQTKILAEFSRQVKGRDFNSITATLQKGENIIQIRPDDSPGLYGLALDLGTTSLVAILCDLENNEVRATASALNPQISFGADVISRIAQVQKDSRKLEAIRWVMIEQINRLIQTVCRECGVSKEQVLDAVAVGNPTMQHLFLGLNPLSLGEAPYLPFCHEGGEMEAKDLALDIHPFARVELLPMPSGFIGGDTVAALITRDPDEFKENLLVVDVGTNGEIVLACKGQLTATSCATGPVFEGAQIRCGMRAAQGAIERVWLDESGLIHYSVVAGKGGGPSKPAGICGSGVISAVSTFISAGVLGKDGAFNPESGHSALRVDPDTKKLEMVIVQASDSATGREILITQDDIRAVQLGKAALRAGVEILLKDGNITSLDRILLAGAFGSYLYPSEVVHIGMLPSVPLEKIQPIGNAAGDGARLALLSLEKRKVAFELSERIRVVELTRRKDFQEIFIDSMGF